MFDYYHFIKGNMMETTLPPLTGRLTRAGISRAFRGARLGCLRGGSGGVGGQVPRRQLLDPPRRAPLKYQSA